MGGGWRSGRGLFPGTMERPARKPRPFLGRTRQPLHAKEADRRPNDAKIGEATLSRKRAVVSMHAVMCVRLVKLPLGSGAATQNNQRFKTAD